MVDEVYQKLNDQVWEIPTSNQYVSDSDSPLSLISSSMPSPTLSPSNAILMSSMMPLFNDQEEKIKLSYPMRSSNDTTYYSKSVKSSTASNTSTTSCIEISTRVELDNDNIQEDMKNNGSLLCHGSGVTYNDAIACIKPESVSIKWSTTSNTVDSSTISSTTIDINQEQFDGYESSSDSISHEPNQDEFTQTTTTSSESSSFNITIPNEIERDEESQSSAGYSFQVENDFPSSQESNDDKDAISFDDIICENECKSTENKPEVTEDGFSKQESDALETPPSVESSKKRKKSDKRKYKSNTSITTTSSSVTSRSSFSSSTAGSTKKRKFTAVVGKSSANSSNHSKYVTGSSNTKPPRKKKRTVTSYDAQTSQYLKSVFFEVYSKQNKLTKEQRAAVQEKTGLPSRNITYWFSNHKRRFQDSLEIYRKAVIDSKGLINCYEDFIQWRKRRGLSEGTK